MAPHGTAVMEVTDTKVSGIIPTCPARHVEETSSVLVLYQPPVHHSIHPRIL